MAAANWRGCDVAAPQSVSGNLAITKYAPVGCPKNHAYSGRLDYPIGLKAALPLPASSACSGDKPENLTDQTDLRIIAHYADIRPETGPDWRWSLLAVREIEYLGNLVERIFVATAWRWEPI
jgi:hypothetical protein